MKTTEEKQKQKLEQVIDALEKLDKLVSKLQIPVSLIYEAKDVFDAVSRALDKPQEMK